MDVAIVERARIGGVDPNATTIISRRVGEYVAAVEVDITSNIDTRSLPNKEGARVLVSSWKARL